MIRPHPTSTLFPYTTLFRSDEKGDQRPDLHLAVVDTQAAEPDQRHTRAVDGQRGDRKHQRLPVAGALRGVRQRDRKSTRLNSSHANISYAVFCLKKKKS